MDGKPLLFISHSSADTAFAKALAVQLENHFRVWLDAFDLRTGAKWQDAIEAAIAECHCAVVVLSPNVKAKPDWVNAEAFAFSMRMRVYDPRFRMVPILLDGFTEADLVAGPLAKAKLAEIQAPTMTSAKVEIDGVMEGLRPVLDEYQALLPFQRVAITLAAVLDGLQSNALEIVATEVGLPLVQLKGAANPSRWLAAALLKCTREQLQAAYRALVPVAPEHAKRLFRIAAPFTWVDPGAARHITRTGLSAPPRPSLAMNALRRETPRLYVRRASLKVPEWITFECEGVFGDDAGAVTSLADRVADDIRSSLAEKLGYGPGDAPTDEELNKELEDAWGDEPVFVVLPPWFAAMDAALLQTLRDTFPRLAFVLWTQTADDTLAGKFPPITCLPPLDPDEERSVYRMYARCIPQGEPLL